MSLVRRLASAAAVGVALTATFAAPSSAEITNAAASGQAASIQIADVAAAPAGCPAGSVCIYADVNYNLGPGLFSDTNANWQDFGSSHGKCIAGVTAAADNQGGWNDCVSSIYNHTDKTFFFYVNVNCSGRFVSLGRQSGIPNVGASVNDALSSDSKGDNPVSC